MLRKEDDAKCGTIIPLGGQPNSLLAGRGRSLSRAANSFFSTNGSLQGGVIMRFQRFPSGGIYVTLTLLSISWITSPSQAALQVYEGFDYPDGTNLRTQIGGIGWADGWQNTGVATETATTPGLSYTALAALGNKASIAGQQNTGGANGANAFLFRNLTQTFGTDDTTTWISFLGQRTGEKSMGGTAQPLNYQRVFSTAFFNVVGTTATEQFSIGELSNDALDVWGLNPTTTVTDTLHSTIPIDTQALLLFKIDHLAGPDNGSLWVNPNLSLGEAGLGTPAATISDDFTFNRIRIQAGGSQNTGANLNASGLWDEIRVGTAFADVTPAPGAGGVLGDYNSNNVVDAADYVVWRDNPATLANEGASLGVVDQADYDFWRTRFGATSGSGVGAGSFAAVPEPATFALFAVATAALVRRRNRA